MDFYSGAIQADDKAFVAAERDVAGDGLLVTIEMR
jgi:hypothetical protein